MTSPEEKTDNSDQIISLKDARQVLNDGFQKIRQVATYLSQEDLSNPRIYRLTRLVAWSTIDEVPSAVNGKTRIPAPDNRLRNILIDLRSKGDWEALLKSAEARLPQFIFWLDLNRLISEALINLGDFFREAQKVVCQETAFFMQRLPSLQNLFFSDGTPTADSETKQWLKEIGYSGDAAATDSFSDIEISATAHECDVIGKEIKEAQVLVKKGKLIEGIERLQRQLRHSFSQREKLLWRLALSQLLVSSHKSKLALPYLEQILQEVERYKLEDWDPELALKSLKIVWIGFQSQSDQVSKDKATEALNRMVKLDPAEALRLEKD